LFARLPGSKNSIEIRNSDPAFTLYLYVYLEVMTPTGESAGVPMLPIVYITLCLPFAFVSVLAFLCFRKRIVV